MSQMIDNRSTENREPRTVNVNVNVNRELRTVDRPVSVIEVSS